MPAQTQQKKRLPEQTSGLVKPRPGSLLVPIVDQPAKKTTQPASPQYTGHSAGLFDESNPNDVSENETMYTTRRPTSTRRWNDTTQPQNQQITTYKTPIPPRRAALQPAQTNEVYHRRRPHFLVWLGAALFIMLIGWIALTALSNWWQTTLDDWHYGRPRTFQIDQNVGHFGYTSHFVALNLNGKIEVIETQPQNPNQQQATHLYIAATLATDQFLTPVTLHFEDLTGSGKLDMLVFIGNSLQVPFYNTGTGFQPQVPGH